MPTGDILPKKQFPLSPSSIITFAFFRDSFSLLQQV
ncbi:uncharacterized protein G2W53_008132 [Senna tora]|uniref:Uncharacterized protein n=1 Tax=Senna tora TaxID=362788 RepID=A0A834X7W5_9FABA|nr:uncharacterized protein G2W53_008132 [Senna tora]